jgi:hypothetical protein
MKHNVSIRLARKLASALCLLACAIPSVQALPPTLSGPSDLHLSSSTRTGQLKVLVTGTAPFQYQWRREGEPIPSLTTDSVQISYLQTNMAGYYDVIVRNAEGSVTSVVSPK